MNSSNPGRRTLFIGIAAALALGMVAVVMLAAVAFWRFTEWGSDAVDHVTQAAAAAVAPLREDARRVVEDTQATVATSVAAVTLAQDVTRGAMENASTTVAQAKDRAAQALREPEAIARHLGEAAAEDASRAIAAAAASVAPVVAGHLDAAHALIPRVARHPTAWPEGLALEQIHYRQVGDITEYSYLAMVPAFDLDALREQLIRRGYVEHVLAQGEGSLEAVYRGERQLLLSATTRDEAQRIDVREMPPAVTGTAGP